jgi:hypothetical protein
MKLLVLLLLASLAFAQGPVYVALWFDTEDYIEPAADDAALRIANDLTGLGVRATFKVVGEKARILESRGRKDVIRALSRHAIGYHSNYHSIHPTPAEYLRNFGYVEGADEFERREGGGAKDVERIFGVKPVCYGQPGSSWGPQSNTALRRMGVPVYLDEGEQVGVDEQPFWYGGLLYIFNMGRYQLRARLDAGAEDRPAYKTFDEAAERLRARGGGLISIYYHPTEFVSTEFWDAVNFANGRAPERAQWVRPHRRTTEESERCYGVLRGFVQHMKSVPGVRFITAADALKLYSESHTPAPDRSTIAKHLCNSITFRETLSPADMLLDLLGAPAQVVDGPTARVATTYASATVPAALFNTAMRDARDFIAHNHRLPNQVFLGAETLSLADFAATLACNAAQGSEITIKRGNLEFERYFSNDPRKAFAWPIHPEGFAAPELMELARLQGWTLKPARIGIVTAP